MPVSVPGNSCKPCITPNNQICPIRLSDLCVFYSGPNIRTNYSVNTGDTLDSILIKLLTPATSPIVVSALAILALLVTVGGYIYTGSTIATWTLPSSSTTIAGKQFVIKNRGSGILTINCSGTSIYLTSPVVSTTINPGDSLTFINDGTYWEVI